MSASVTATPPMSQFGNIVSQATAREIRRKAQKNAAPGVRTSENSYALTETPSQETLKDAKSSYSFTVNFTTSGYAPCRR